MSDKAWAPDLKALADRYEVLGELRGTDRLRSYVGHRSSDGADVVILVARTPKGGENNDLTHFAADTQLLSNIGYPAMPRVLEGRWLGADSVAVISERVRGSTLSAVTSGDEPLSFPKVAAVLQQVHGVMEWARSHGVVHRGVSPDSITIEDGTGRVMVSLIPTAIPMEGVPDACADARALGALAFELLTGEPYADGDAMEQMKELRPQLAHRVQDEVRAMMQCQSAQRTPDVHTFIAMIAAADEMRVGEEERARLEAEMVQAHRLECEKWEAQRKQLEERIAEDERRLKLQQTALETSEAEHRDRLAADLAALEAQRQAADERTRVAEEHARRAEARTRELEAQTRELESRSRELDSREAELEEKYASVMPTIEAGGEDEVRGTEPSELAALAASAENPEDPEELAESSSVLPEADRDVEYADYAEPERNAVAAADVDAEEPPHRRSWTLPAAAIGLVLLVVLGIALAHRRPTASLANAARVGRTAVVPGTPQATTPPASPLTGIPAPTVSDSAAGSVAALGRPDSAAARAARDSAIAAGNARSRAAAAPVHKAAERPVPASPATSAEPVYGPPAASDSMVLVPLPASQQPQPRAGDSTRSRRDSTTRDTTARRDTTRSDSTSAGAGPRAA